MSVLLFFCASSSPPSLLKFLLPSSEFFSHHPLPPPYLRVDLLHHLPEVGSAERLDGVGGAVADVLVIHLQYSGVVQCSIL